MTQEQEEKAREYANDAKGQFHTCNNGEPCLKCDAELEEKAKAGSQECLDCHSPLELEEIIESILVHEIVICQDCLAIRRNEDAPDLKLKDL